MDREPNDPRVAVIIPTFNRATELQRCLESLVGQSYKDFHVVLVDDGSTDNTEAIVRGFSKKLQIRYLRIENTGLPAKARNHGVRHTNSPILAFLDSDDWWHPRKLEVSLKSAPSGSFLTYHDVYRRPSKRINLGRRRIRSKDISRNPLDLLVRRGNQITTSTVVVSRILLTNIGGFNEAGAYRGGEDYELWLRIAESECRFRKVQGAWAYYWAGGGNLSEPENTYRLFLRLYENCESNSRAIPGWIYFGLGWSSFHLGDLEAARRNLFRAFVKRKSLRRNLDKLHILKLILQSYRHGSIT